MLIVEKIKDRLIDDAKRWWRMFSVQAMILAGAVQGAWAAFGDDLKQDIPHWMVTTITLGLLAAGICGRLVKQPNATPVATADAAAGKAAQNPGA